MRIGIVTPAPARSRYGNRVTALRWAAILRRLGKRVHVVESYRNQSYDVLVALHARRSYDAVCRFRSRYPDRPLIVALTGTDLYWDLRKSRDARTSLELASRLIVLQPKALEELQPHLQSKVRLIYQSVAPRAGRTQPTGLRTSARSSGQNLALAPAGRRSTFRVCVIGHLRAVKDPFRAALASRYLPSSSRILVLHVGKAMNSSMAAQARAEMLRNPRYRWLGERPRWQVRRLLNSSRLCVLSSRMEGGANVLSEAIMASVPVLASYISGNIGILGGDYRGYFDFGATRQLAKLLHRAETDNRFLKGLNTHCRKLVPLFDPAREKLAWASLLHELFQKNSRRC